MRKPPAWRAISIAITGSLDSPLARHSDVVVDSIEIDDDGPTTVAAVTLSRRTESLVLRDLLGLDSWYDVSVTRAGPLD